MKTLTTVLPLLLFTVTALAQGQSTVYFNPPVATQPGPMYCVPSAVGIWGCTQLGLSPGVQITPINGVQTAVYTSAAPAYTKTAWIGLTLSAVTGPLNQGTPAGSQVWCVPNAPSPTGTQPQYFMPALVHMVVSATVVVPVTLNGVTTQTIQAIPPVDWWDFISPDNSPTTSLQNPAGIPTWKAIDATYCLSAPSVTVPAGTLTVTPTWTQTLSAMGVAVHY